MRRGIVIWFATALICLLVQPKWVAAQTPVRFYHVWAGQEGPERGTAAQPFKEIASALAVANAGDYVRVATGPGIVYSGGLRLQKAINLQGGYDPISWQRQPGAYSVLDGQGSGPVVMLGPWDAASSSAVLQGFLIRNGEAREGAGVLCRQVSARILDNRITGNVALRGGGIAALGGSCTLSGNEIEGNVAHQDGGGVYLADCVADLVDNRIVANESLTGHGGGIHASGAVILVSKRNRIIANQAVSGGGVYGQAGVALTCLGDGFALNTATVAGGGLAISGGYLGLQNVSVIGNGATTGGGLYALLTSTVGITNCLFWDQQGGDVVGGALQIRHSDIQDRLWPGAGNLSVDPHLMPNMAAMRLAADSPLIDRGWPQAPIALDIDGQPRQYDGDGDGTAAIDIGADEVAADLAGVRLFPLDSLSAPIPGGWVRWRLRIPNAGQVDAVSVLVTQTLPVGAELVPGSLSATGGVAEQDGKRLYWRGACAVGSDVEVDFVLRVTDDTLAGSWWVLTTVIAYGASEPLSWQNHLLIRSPHWSALPHLCR